MTEDQTKLELSTEICGLLHKIKETVKDPENHLSLMTHIDSLIQEFKEIRSKFESTRELQEHREYYEKLLESSLKSDITDSERARLIAGG